jgi:GntR family transcriptional regulator/MocR family aminotransferase
MQFSFLSEVSVDRHSPIPLYLQIAKGISKLVKKGVLQSGQKLPGSRLLAEKLGVHRSTLMLALDELQAEGWLVSKEKSGWYVSEKLPLQQAISTKSEIAYPQISSAQVEEIPTLDFPQHSHLPLQFDDGYPDTRIAPLLSFGKAYRSILGSHAYRSLFSYSSPQGDEKLREKLSQSLQLNRGLRISPEQIFITRGSIMGLYLLSQVLLRPSAKMVVGKLSYRTANLVFGYREADLLTIPVDEEGLVTDALEALLNKKKIRAIYVTSHHHYPTTVPLAPHRRLHLYELARKHRFFILEDDYDYDFHYDHKPLMPLASMDEEGLVLYIGSFTKKISPAIRVGYVVAPQNIIRELIKLRRIIDRQGSNLEERALADLLEDGTIKRFTRKALQTYRQRRDLFCSLLSSELSEEITFREPEGGMAVWAKFREDIDMEKLARVCAKKGLYVSDGKIYSPEDEWLNSCRMGFASMNLAEIEEGMGMLKNSLKSL